MPRLRQTVPKFDRVQRVLRSYGLNGSRIAPVLKISPVTARKKMRDPWLFTIKDLDAISRYYGIPWDEILEAMVH